MQLKFRLLRKSLQYGLTWLGLVILMGSLAGLALAAAGDKIADAVLGQPNFKKAIPNNGGVSARSLAFPGSVAIDPQSGRLYVADFSNSRVLSWPSAAAFTNRQPADKVFGQPNFSSNTPNNGGISARSLNLPAGVAVDSRGNLYVADLSNNRVLQYNNPASQDTTADKVFGQSNFSSSAPNNGGIGANSLADPLAVAVDSQGNLYVADHVNHRVLRYDKPIGTVGVSELTPELGSSPAGQLTQFNLAWTIPATGTWRDLQHLDLRLVPTEAGPDAPPLFWLRFNEIEPASFSLLDANGVVVDSGLPGENRRLESEAVVLDLAASSFSHEGPGAPTLTLTLSLSFKPAAAGQVFDIEALASDDLGNAEGPEVVGVWEVQPVAGLEQHIYLPLILR